MLSVAFLNIGFVIFHKILFIVADCFMVAVLCIPFLNTSLRGAECSQDIAGVKYPHPISYSFWRVIGKHCNLFCQTRDSSDGPYVA